MGNPRPNLNHTPRASQSVPGAGNGGQHATRIRAIMSSHSQSPPTQMESFGFDALKDTF